jgi:hypothetical protein
MLGDRKERWMELSECASKEQDPQKLSELVAEIDRMLQEKQDRLHPGHSSFHIGRSLNPNCTPTELSSSAAAPSTKQAYL